MSFIRLMLFCIATLGSFELLRIASKDEVNIYFLPSLTIAIQTTILFFAGILNLLPEAAKLLYIIGALGLAYAIRKRGNLYFLKDYINIGYVFLFLIMAAMAFYVKGKLFTHYDNFSHWAMVVRRMLLTNRFPNFLDTIIFFPEYPLGSAVYIYFFAKLLGTSESLQMLAQIYMIAAAVLPLFIFAKKNTIPAFIVMLAFVNFIFLYNTQVTDLLVDTLLPVVGMCGLMFTVVHCRGGITGTTPVFLSCYMIQLQQIKNSGIFFAALIIGCVLFYAAKNRKLKKYKRNIYIYINMYITICQSAVMAKALRICF